MPLHNVDYKSLPNRSTKEIPKGKVALSDPSDWDSLVHISAGVGAKPQPCRNCVSGYTGQGFCPDSKGTNVKIALLCDHPGAADVVNNAGLTGKGGEIFWTKVAPYVGLTRDDFLISNVLRCRPPNNVYPTASHKKNSENMCRMYDNHLVDYDPNLFICTYHPRDIITQFVYLRLLQEDIKRAKTFYEQGYRPLVLMGKNAVQLLYAVPFMPGKGGLRMWRGHYWTGEWPFASK